MALRKGAFPVPILTGIIPRLPATSFGSYRNLAAGSTDSSRKLSDLFNGWPGKESKLMASWKDMPKTPTTTNESAAQGGESHNDPETETPEVPSGCSSMPETPALDRVPFGEPRVHTSNGDMPFVWR